MNRIRTSRLDLAGLVTLLVFILLELLWEGVIGTVLFGDQLAALRISEGIPDWSFGEHILNLTVALFNCFIMIWLYASLRPMFGVGPRTALIASAFVFAFVFAFYINYANLGYISYRLGLVYAVDLIVELPLALIAGAQVYENGGWVPSQA